MNTGIPDNEIIRRVLRGDQSIYAELVSRYQNFVFTLVLKYVPQREDAEEIAQDVFVKAYRFLSDYKGDTARFSTWLYAIAQNTCLSFLRKKKVKAASLDDEKNVINVEQTSSKDGASKMEQQHRTRAVNDAIEMLGPDDKYILTLFYKADQSLEEIGMILHVDPNTAKVRLHRARKRLKDRLEQYWSKEINEIL